MKQTKTSKIALLSILTALSVVLGYIVKIPTQTGILTLLDAGIFFTAFYYGKREGAIVGGLGGFIIDLILEKKDRQLAGPTAAPNGLYLKEIRYEE